MEFLTFLIGRSIYNQLQRLLAESRKSPDDDVKSVSIHLLLSSRKNAQEWIQMNHVYMQARMHTHTHAHTDFTPMYTHLYIHTKLPKIQISEYAVCLYQSCSLTNLNLSETNSSDICQAHATFVSKQPKELLSSKACCGEASSIYMASGYSRTSQQ